MFDYLKAADMVAEVGMDKGEFLKRAAFLEGIRIAVAREDVGFRGGWVNSSHINSDLHPKLWADLLGALGYVLHQTMEKFGRSENLINGKRARLFIQVDAQDRKIQGSQAAIHAYKAAQM